MIEASEAIESFLRDKDEEDFVEDDLLRSAVLHKLMVVGEAASRLPPDLRKRYPNIPWREIVSFWNIVVHRYFSIDWSIVWDAATLRVPQLKEDVAVIIHSEFGGD